MKSLSIIDIARSLVARGKGIMAADRPRQPFEKMLADSGSSVHQDSYRDWSELLFTAPALNDYVSGIIMTDEQVRMKSAAGESLLEGSLTAA